MSISTPIRLLVFIACAQHLSAQCLPQILNCPAAPVQVCDTSQNSTQFWNAPQWWDFNISSQNMADAPVDLSVTATSPCGSPLTISYLLFLDLNGDGQSETVVNSQQLPPAGMVRFNNINTPNYAGGQSRLFDQRPVQALFRYKFAIETKTAAGVTTARLRWRSNASVVGGALPQLPYGTHRIRWTVKSGGGEETVCEYQVVVKDCGKPQLTCSANLTYDLGVCSAIELSTFEFVADFKDNYWPYHKAKFKLLIDGTETEVPVDQFDPSPHLKYDCNDLGTHIVEVRSQDQAGNTGQCTFQLTITDSNHFCTAPNRLYCATRWCDGGGLTHADWVFIISEVGIPTSTKTISDEQGQGCIRVCKGYGTLFHTTITPTKDDHPLEGVDDADVIAIQKHISGEAPFTETWQYIAADVNKSGSITNFDAEEVKKLITGIYTDFPNNSAWRFVPADFVFPHPLNPFQSAFPESIALANAPNDTVFLFRAIKIGDVNCSLNFTDPGSENRRYSMNENTKNEPVISAPQPNPTTGGATIRLQLPEAGAIQIMVSDASGRPVFRQLIENTAYLRSIEIPASAFPQTGLYLWQIQTGKITKSGKIIRQ